MYRAIVVPFPSLDENLRVSYINRELPLARQIVILGKLFRFITSVVGARLLIPSILLRDSSQFRHSGKLPFDARKE